MNWRNESVQLLMKHNNINDPIDYIKDKVRELVLDAFDKGWSGPPFNPIKLAHLLGLDVVPSQGVFDARIVPSRNNKVLIEYNPYQKNSRINFSISHEIGHTLFPDYKEKIRNREEEVKNDNREIEFLCNIAAAEILLPYSEFSKEANTRILNLDSLIDIARKYEASLEAVFLRFCDVIDSACAVIIASFDIEMKNLTIDYFKNSRSFPYKISPTSIIPNDSKAFECINSGWTDYSHEKWNVFSNDDMELYFIGLPPLKKSKNQRVGIFIVPFNNVFKEEIKIKEVFGDATQPRGDGIKIIAQLVNTSGALGFGFGKSMSKKWPLSKKIVNQWKLEKDFILGNYKLTNMDNNIYVFQMLAQKGLFPKGSESLIRYSALRKCLRELAQIADNLNASIHMPKIGAGQARGDWSLIEGIIHDELIQRDISVTIYTIPGQDLKKNKSTSLSLFDDSNLYEK